MASSTTTLLNSAQAAGQNSEDEEPLAPIFETPAVADRDPPPEPLGELLSSDGFAAVDNSGSTGGLPLRIAESFVAALDVRKVSLWNNYCDPPLDRQAVRWRSTGGTQPQSVFEPHSHVPQGARALVFMTDGMVHNTQPLARHANVTAHLPSLLVIFTSAEVHSVSIQHLNVSVLMAHFSAARTAAVVVINAEDGPARLIATKGDWLLQLPPCPDLNPGLPLMEMPVVEVSQLAALSSRVYSATRAGTVPLDSRRSLHLGLLLQMEDPGEIEEVLQQMTAANYEDVARALFTLGRLGEWRNRLNGWLTLLNQGASAQVEEATQETTTTIHGLLRRVRNAGSDAERQVFSSQLQRAMQAGAGQAADAARVAGQERRDTRRIINEQLEIAAALEQSGMSAAALGRLSNRAARANTVDRHTIPEMVSLDLSGAPEEEDLIMFESGPVALCLRAMEDTEDNTGDYALDQPLRAGQDVRNAVFEPTLVAIRDGVADQIERLDASPMTRQRLSVCLPIVSLESEGNRRAVYDRLCMVFMNELRMRHVWLIALSSMLRALECHEWAGPESTATGRLLTFMSRQIMQYVTLPAGSRLSPTTALPVEQALVHAYNTEIVTVHSTVVEASVILRLLRRYSRLAPVSDDALMRAIQARVAIAIPQSHRNWLQRNADNLWADQGPASLAALMTSIYDTRVSEQGRHVPIAGTGRLADSLQNLLMPQDLEAIHAFARLLGVSTDSLVTPGLSLVILACRTRLTNGALSSAAAVQTVRNSELSGVAAEMDPQTAGLVTEDEAIVAVRRHLAWARTPLGIASPFTTPLGPSVLWFYAGDGTIIDMTEGFEILPGENEEDRDGMMERLTEHIRVVRGRLMARFYGTSIQGSLVQGTIAAPVHRAMVDELAASDIDEDLRDEGRAARFIHRTVQRLVARSGSASGNLHYESMERMAAMLLPSLIQAMESFPDLPRPNHAADGERRGGALAQRVALELGSRMPGALGEPPTGVHVPLDDPEFTQRLARVAQEQIAAKVSAMRQRRNASHTAQTSDAVAGQQVTEAHLQKISRRLTWYLRHDASTRPDGFVSMQTVLQFLDTAGLTADMILSLVEADGKGRYDVREESEGLFIRANQVGQRATLHWWCNAPHVVSLIVLFLLPASWFVVFGTVLRFRDQHCNPETDPKDPNFHGGPYQPGRWCKGSGTASLIHSKCAQFLSSKHQGHSITTIDPEQLMTPIEDPEEVPICLHGTYEQALRTIVRTGHLDRMSRQAIQMAIGLPGDPEVRSGIRASVEVVIYIDVQAAMAQGLSFYRSSNNVICCPGPIPVSCFLRVVKLQDGSLIDIPAMIAELTD